VSAKTVDKAVVGFGKVPSDDFLNEARTIADQCLRRSKIDGEISPFTLEIAADVILKLVSCQGTPAPTPDAGSGTGGTITGIPAWLRPPPGEDLAGQGEPLPVWIRRAIMANLKGEADGVDEAVAVIVSNLKALAPDLAGQGEPVASVEQVVSRLIIANPDKAKQAVQTPEKWGWFCGRIAESGISYEVGKQHLYALLNALAAPAPSRPADREEIAKWRDDALEKAAAIVRRYEPFADDAVQDILALRDAPRDAGDEWRPIDTAPKDGTKFDAWGVHPATGTMGGRFANVQMRGDDSGFGIIIHQPKAHWEYLEKDGPTFPAWKLTHWRPLPAPPSPNVGDGAQGTDQGGGRA
jgi:hypothetical protein